MPDKDNSVEMPNQENINAKSDLSVEGSWYLVRVMSKRRNLFLKYLEMSISKNKLEELILEIKIPAAAIYEDILLLNLSNRKEASTYLQNIEYFQRIEPKPLKSEDVNRMLGAK